MLHRRDLFGAALGAAASGLARPALAQGEWPTKPVRIIVPYPPGGATDVLARLYAERLAAVLGQPFVVDNRPGAGGNIGTDRSRRRRPTGTRSASPPSASWRSTSSFTAVCPSTR